jgi:asparagine synthetase B (glutamine-hydrolysing)
VVPKKSIAKLILNGLGADEVFGGYSRYYTHLKNKQMEELKAEFALDLDRLWIRNFGRDDRCISYHNKTCAFPYLDLSVIEFAARIPMQELFYEDELYKLNKKVLRDLATECGFE